MHVVSDLQEGRKLKFWYVDAADYLDKMTTSFEFFKELLKPENFPKGKESLNHSIQEYLLSIGREIVKCKTKMREQTVEFEIIHLVLTSVNAIRSLCYLSCWLLDNCLHFERWKVKHSQCYWIQKHIEPKHTNIVKILYCSTHGMVKKTRKCITDINISTWLASKTTCQGYRRLGIFVSCTLSRITLFWDLFDS